MSASTNPQLIGRDKSKGWLVTPGPAGSVSALVLDRARSSPDRIALAFPSVEGKASPSVTYSWLARRVARFASGFAGAGLRPGDRVALLAQPSPDVYALILALDAAGLVTVVADGATHPRRVLAALRAAAPQAIVASRSVLRFWPLVGPLRRARRFCVDRLFGCDELALLLGDERAFFPARRDPNHTALISFTSGTGGRPKGAERTAGIIAAQMSALQNVVQVAERDVWMAFFPLVALHVLCVGATAVLPPADLRSPASADPARLLDALRSYSVSSIACAPAVMERLVRHLAGTGERLTTVRQVVIGGGPVSRELCTAVRQTFPTARGAVVYGSTEAEPIAAATIEDVIAARDPGYMAGIPVPEAEVALISLHGAPHLLGSSGIAPFLVPAGEHGEIVVRGPHVNRRYVANAQAEAATKLREPDGSVWHRTGDVGRLDWRGRLWLTGRVGDLVEHRGATVHPFVIEADVARLRGVRRCALVAGHHASSGRLCVELDDGATAVLAAVRSRLSEMGLQTLAVRAVERIPMDARHASKVDRSRLRELTARRQR